jgi:hypothetical protein
MFDMILNLKFKLMAWKYVPLDQTNEIVTDPRCSDECDSRNRHRRNGRGGKKAVCSLQRRTGGF